MAENQQGNKERKDWLRQEGREIVEGLGGYMSRIYQYNAVVGLEEGEMPMTMGSAAATKRTRPHRATKQAARKNPEGKTSASGAAVNKGTKKAAKKRAAEE